MPRLTDEQTVQWQSCVENWRGLLRGADADEWAPWADMVLALDARLAALEAVAVEARSVCELKRRIEATPWDEVPPYAQWFAALDALRGAMAKLDEEAVP